MSQKYRDLIKANNASMCCCCVCQCEYEDPEAKALKCCLLFPLKCAVQTIGIIVVTVVVCQFLEIFYQILNDNIDWWYILVGVLLSVPLIIAGAFAICFFNKETDHTRVLLRSALILTIISITLSAAWNSVYFWFFYKHHDVVTGNDGVGYTRATKKQEIVFSVYFALVLDCFFAYFLCIVNNAIHAHREARINNAVEKAKDYKENPKPADEEAPLIKNEGEDAGATNNGGDKPEGEPKEEKPGEATETKPEEPANPE